MRHQSNVSFTPIVHYAQLGRPLANGETVAFAANIVATGDIYAGPYSPETFLADVLPGRVHRAFDALGFSGVSIQPATETGLRDAYGISGHFQTKSAHAQETDVKGYVEAALFNACNGKCRVDNVIITPGPATNQTRETARDNANQISTRGQGAKAPREIAPDPNAGNFGNGALSDLGSSIGSGLSSIGDAVGISQLAPILGVSVPVMVGLTAIGAIWILKNK